MNELEKLANEKRKEAEKQVLALQAWMDPQEIPLVDRPMMLAMASGKALRAMNAHPRRLSIALCQSILETCGS